jgi:hypothetical protein
LANVLTDIGKKIVTGRLMSVLPTDPAPGWASPRFIGWGTGTNVAAAANIALQTEAAETRATGTTTQEQQNVDDDTFQVQGTMTAAANKTISEAGLFDKVTGGNLFVRGDFTGVPLLSGDSIAFTFRWTIT